LTGEELMDTQKTICITVVLFLVSIFSLPVQAQNRSDDRITPTPDPKSKYEVYIPKDLDDCFTELKKMLPSKVLKKIREKNEEDMIEYHMGLGLWLRNNWGLWGGSRLKTYFNKIGIFHPDDMSGLILTTFWRHLHNKPLEVENEVARYKEYWEQQLKTKQKKQAERKQKQT
jgi:hypothetical protein